MSNAPIRTGHADQEFAGETCGCCDGTAFATPMPTPNRPNLTAIAFRSGQHGQFKASMLAGLSSADKLPLARLGTRDDDDFSIALIDVWASACDVLSFYQERLANEAFMETARERFSIGELARLIGYRLHPGSAAETDLVLLMDDPPGAVPAVTELIVPTGTRVQSQPGPDEVPQVFETIEEIETRVAWNRLVPRRTRPSIPGTAARAAWVDGTPGLQKGDAIVFIGPERWNSDDSDNFNVDSDRWDFRRVISAEPDADGKRTRVIWDLGLNDVDEAGLRLFALRERASLFGYNAPDPRVFSADQATQFGSDIDSTSGDWDFQFPFGFSYPLDAIYKSFVQGGWTVFTAGLTLRQLYRIENAFDFGRTAYATSGKATYVIPDTLLGREDFRDSYRAVSVYGGSEELAFAERPINRWVEGFEIVLDGLAQDLPEGRKLIFHGRRARLRVRANELNIETTDGTTRNVTEGAELTLMAPPVPIEDMSTLLWELRDTDGFTGHASAQLGAFQTIPATDEIETIAEAVILDRVEPEDTSHSKLILKTGLMAAFDHTSLAIHANVARAAHGEGVTEILGGGDPALPFQKFPLKQAPVTHRLAATETGIESTLSVRIDGIAWEEMPDLYDRGPNARVFRTVLSDEGDTVIEFGDGHSGARPPPGRDNIVAQFSRGIGLAGNLRAGQLTMPLDRPLGLRETDNPLPATGGDEAEAASDARRNAPIYTLTLGRVVSITDYRDFALGFPGIAKAEARWVWLGETRRVVVTVAGPGGVEIPSNSATHDTLLEAYRTLGDPLVGVDLLSYIPTHFRLGLKVAVDSAYEDGAVLEAVEAALRAALGFAARDFAQVVALSEIAQAVHAVSGVRAIDVDRLYRVAPPQTVKKPHNLLIALPSRQNDDGLPLPAEILTLVPDPLDKLEVMA